MDWSKLRSHLQHPINKHDWFVIVREIALAIEVIGLRGCAEPLCLELNSAISQSQSRALYRAAEETGLVPYWGALQQIEARQLYCTNRAFAAAGREHAAHQRTISQCLAHVGRGLRKGQRHCWLQNMRAALCNYSHLALVGWD
jgi:hypothetical protein